MARIQSAKKAHRASLRKAVFNLRAKRAMRDAVREFSNGAHAKGSGAVALLPVAYAAIDKAAKRGVIKRNAAARMKSRLSKQVS